MRIPVAITLVTAFSACCGAPATTAGAPSPSGLALVVLSADIRAAVDRLPPGDPEATCTGSVVLTIDPTRRPPLDLASGQFEVTLNGCAPDSVITDIHVHKDTEANISMAGQVTGFPLSNGSGSGTFTGSVKPAIVDDLAANAAAFYINLHSRRHPNGFMRGDLQRRP